MQSQTVVSALLAKAVPNIKPEKPVSSKKGKAEAEKVVKSGGAQKSNPLAKSSSRGKVNIYNFFFIDSYKNVFFVLGACICRSTNNWCP